MATQIAFSDLDTWLGNQPENTIDTPYELEITGLTTSDFGSSQTSGSLGSILYTTRHRRKFVDLRNTVIPEGVTSLRASFYQCFYLVYAPVLPSTVTDMQACFQDCPALKVPPLLPNGVTSLHSCFSLCDNLSEAPVIPNSVTNMRATFGNCLNLTNAPVIPSNVTNMYQCFWNCTSLKKPPLFPENVIDVTKCFGNCSSLEYKPLIPNSATTTTDCYLDVTQTAWGCSLSDVNTWVEAQSNEFTLKGVEADTDNNCYNITRTVYGVDISNLDTWLASMDSNTKDTPYDVKILNLTSNNLTTMRSDLQDTYNVFVDLRRTVLPNDEYTNLSYLFYGCITLVYSPELPDNNEYITSMNYSFQDCVSLKEAPAIPDTVVILNGTFKGCISLQSTPTLSGSNLLQLWQTFEDCSNLRTAGSIPSSVTSIESAFKNCLRLTTVSALPNSITNMKEAFRGNTSLKTVPNIPSSVTKMNNCFNGCSALEKISVFEVPLNTLKNNADFQNMFTGCTSLTQIGYKVSEASSWHVVKLVISDESNKSYVSGKVFDSEGNSVNITKTEITKDKLTLPVKTDELWFPTAGESNIDIIIGKMIQYKYTVWNKTVLPPDQKSFVMYAQDPDNFITNLKMGGGMEVYETLEQAEADLANLPVDTQIGTLEGGGGVSNSVENGDLRPVTSNAVSQSLSYSTTEQKTGGVWIDGRTIYKKTVDCGNIPANTSRAIPHNIASIDKIIVYEGITVIGDGVYITLPYLNTASLNYSAQLQIAKADNIVIRTVNYALSNTYVTIFYTKTTD